MTMRAAGRGHRRSGHRAGCTAGHGVGGRRGGCAGGRRAARRRSRRGNPRTGRSSGKFAAAAIHADTVLTQRQRHPVTDQQQQVDFGGRSGIGQPLEPQHNLAIGTALRRDADLLQGRQIPHARHAIRVAGGDAGADIGGIERRLVGQRDLGIGRLAGRRIQTQGAEIDCQRRARQAGRAGNARKPPLQRRYRTRVWTVHLRSHCHQEPTDSLRINQFPFRLTISSSFCPVTFS